jgi:hypothetical protein
LNSTSITLCLGVQQGLFSPFSFCFPQASLWNYVTASTAVYWESLDNSSIPWSLENPEAVQESLTCLWHRPHEERPHAVGEDKLNLSRRSSKKKPAEMRCLYGPLKLPCTVEQTNKSEALDSQLLSWWRPEVWNFN